MGSSQVGPAILDARGEYFHPSPSGQSGAPRRPGGLPAPRVKETSGQHHDLRRPLSVTPPCPRSGCPDLAAGRRRARHHRHPRPVGRRSSARSSSCSPSTSCSPAARTRSSMREAVGWSAFYVALPLAFGGYVWPQLRLRARRGVPHRLPGREVAERRQPVRVHAAARRVRGARASCSSGCCSTASSARWCCAAIFIALGAAALQRLRLDVPGLRAGPGRHRGQDPARRASRGHDHEVDVDRAAQRPARAPVRPGHRRLRRPAAARPRSTAGAR